MMLASDRCVLVVGGAGYIGSHMVSFLQEQGVHVVVLDNLSRGYRDAVKGAELVVGCMSDQALLELLFSRYQFCAVIHFAAFMEVGESVSDPSKYYRNNVSASLVLLDAMVKSGVRNLIFSSTAAVYGLPNYTPMDELHDRVPINPYGRSKLMIEQILQDYDVAYGLRSVCLRYFNAAGARYDRGLGECHAPETHLIPLVLQVAAGRKPHISVFGTDYDTPDGTCIRDYVHVADLCNAHALALEYLLQDGQSTAFNLGGGVGYSVKEVIKTVRLVTGRNVDVVFEPRRRGDPPCLIADCSRVEAILKWRPEHNLKEIVADAWAWELMYGGDPMVLSSVW